LQYAHKNVTPNDQNMWGALCSVAKLQADYNTDYAMLQSSTNGLFEMRNCARARVACFTSFGSQCDLPALIFISTPGRNLLRANNVWQLHATIAAARAKQV